MDLFLEYIKNSKNATATETSQLKKSCTDTLPTKIYRWQVGIGRDAQHQLSAGKCKLTHGDTYTPITMADIQETNTTKGWRGCAATGTLAHPRWRCRRVQPLWRTVRQLLTKLNTDTPYAPATVLPGISSNELKTQKPVCECLQQTLCIITPN